jgi:PTH1 family peptidyl-tRNA hydrolase
MIRLIVGLGNPGPRYAATRHNVGWMVLDAFAAKHGFTFDKNAHKGLLAEGRYGGEKIALLKPQTFMNLSGQSVAPAARWYKVEPQEMLVLYDDLDLPPGKLRLREKGSSGGHNGMKSIIADTGSQDFPRLRIGIGRPAPGWSVPDWVLAPFTKEEQPLIARVVERAVGALEEILTVGFTKAMNTYNRDE